MLHVIFVSFVFSMIFGHAPIILPALLGVAALMFYATRCAQVGMLQQRTGNGGSNR